MKALKFLTCMLSVFLLSACGGGLSDEQRKSLKEEMEAREIKKVAEEDIVAETFRQGKKVLKYHQAGNDSVAKEIGANIYMLSKDDSVSNKIDWELIEAYKYSLTHGGPLADNVQRDKEEMIYTMPYLENEEFKGMYVVRIPRKKIILSL